jgi:hypothetical protein
MYVIKIRYWEYNAGAIKRIKEPRLRAPNHGNVNQRELQINDYTEKICVARYE